VILDVAIAGHDGRQLIAGAADERDLPEQV
jgi:hypothetical protein